MCLIRHKKASFVFQGLGYSAYFQRQATNSCLLLKQEMLPQSAIKEFQALYKKLYGIAIDDDEALRRAENLVGLYVAVYAQSTRLTSSAGAVPSVIENYGSNE